MTSRETLHVVIGAESFAIKPLTLRQVEAIDAALAEKLLPIATAKKVLGVALARDHGGLVVDDLIGGADDVTKAMSQILRHGGFLPGEATAAARKSASNGGPSAAV